MWWYYFRFAGGVLTNERGRMYPASKKTDELGDYRLTIMSSCVQLEICALNYEQSCDLMGMVVNQLRTNVFGMGKEPRTSPYSNTGVGSMGGAK